MANLKEVLAIITVSVRLIVSLYNILNLKSEVESSLSIELKKRSAAAES